MTQLPNARFCAVQDAQFFTYVETDFSNQNGFIDQNEVIDIFIEIFADSGESVPLTTAAISSTDFRTSIVQGFSTYPAMDAGESAINTTPFQLRIHEAASCDFVNIILTVNNNGQNCEFPITIPIGEYIDIRLPFVAQE